MTTNTCPTSPTDRVLDSVGIYGLGWIALTTIALYLLPTGYNPVTQVVSDYAVGPCSVWMMIGFFAGGIGDISLALVLSRKEDRSRLHKIGSALVLIAGIMIFIVGYSGLT